MTFLCPTHVPPAPRPAPVAAAEMDAFVALMAARFARGGRPPAVVEALRAALGVDAPRARFVVRAALDRGLAHTDSHFALHPGRHPNSL